MEKLYSVMGERVVREQVSVELSLWNLVAQTRRACLRAIGLPVDCIVVDGQVRVVNDSGHGWSSDEPVSPTPSSEQVEIIRALDLLRELARRSYS